MSRNVYRGRTRAGFTRAGFTLVELLVVIAIIVVLAALLLMFYPSLSTQTAEANGAANFQGWLNIARQRAIRNQNPYGLRLWIKDVTTMYVTECSYIEQPEDLRGGTIVTRDWQNNNPPLWNTIAITPGTMDPTGGFLGAIGTVPDPTLFLVQPGDYIEILGTGLMHQITGIDTNPLTGLITVPLPVPAQPWNPNPPPIPGHYLTLATPIPYQIGQFDPTPPPPKGNGQGLPISPTQTANFRIMRAARNRRGDDAAADGGRHRHQHQPE